MARCCSDIDAVIRLRGREAPVAKDAGTAQLLYVVDDGSEDLVVSEGAFRQQLTASRYENDARFPLSRDVEFASREAAKPSVFSDDVVRKVGRVTLSELRGVQVFEE